jgi:hypothetical protein
MTKMFDEQGELQLIDMIIARTEEHPEVQRDIENSVKRNGFGSLDNFAEVGDQVLLTSIRMGMSQSEVRELQQSANIPEAQLAMVPANMRPMLERMSMFAKALDKVPEADVALVRQYKDRFEALSE